MNRFDDYKIKISNIKPREELVDDTINKIKKMEEEQNRLKRFNIINRIRKIIVGMIATAGVTATCFAGYVAISGNVEILEKIGIKLSKNYENNAQVVNETVIDNKVSLTLETVAIDNAFIVAKYNIKTNKDLGENIKVEVNSISFYNEQIERNVEFGFDSKQITDKNDDGTYSVYGIYYINEVKNTDQSVKYAIEDGEIQEYGGDLISYVFNERMENGIKKYLNENVEICIDVIGVYDENNKFISGATEKNNWDFRFIVNSSKNTGKLLTNSERAESFDFKGLEIYINVIRENEFGTYIMVSVGEKYGEVNDNIANVDIIVKDQNGKILKVISEYEEVYDITDFDAYGRSFVKHMIVDVEESVKDYKIELVTRQEKQRDL